MKKNLFALCVITLTIIAATAVYAQTEYGLISCWKFDEGHGTTAVDSFGFNDGTIYGASWVPGIAGSALSFDGQNDYVLVNHDDSLNTGEMSFELWVNPNVASSFLLYKYCLSTGFFVREVSTKWIFHLNGWVVYSNSDIDVGAWTHLAGTYDGSSLRIYVNGVNEATEYPLRPLINDNIQPLKFGTSLASYFNGVIDEIALYDRALTSEEIEQHYLNGLQGWGCGEEIIEIVDIDIKPGSDPNSINLRNKGVIPVAILTTDDFDATTVDPLSVAFGPDEALEVHGQGHMEDVDEDGDLDLILHFNTQDTGIICSDQEAGLTGEAFDGQMIEGFDSIHIVMCY